MQFVDFFDSAGKIYNFVVQLYNSDCFNNLCIIN